MKNNLCFAYCSSTCIALVSCESCCISVFTCKCECECTYTNKVFATCINVSKTCTGVINVCKQRTVFAFRYSIGHKTYANCSVRVVNIPIKTCVFDVLCKIECYIVIKFCIVSQFNITCVDKTSVYKNFDNIVACSVVIATFATESISDFGFHRFSFLCRSNKS